MINLQYPFVSCDIAANGATANDDPTIFNERTPNINTDF
jgi:hypothetical protein